MQGTSSLVKNSVYGVSNSVSKVTDTVASGVSKLSWNQQFNEERSRRIQTEQPSNVGEGLWLGAKGLGKDVVGGVTGVFVRCLPCTARQKLIDGRLIQSLARPKKAATEGGSSRQRALPRALPLESSGE